jgi:hypothetical protein
MWEATCVLYRNICHEFSACVHVMQQWSDNATYFLTFLLRERLSLRDEVEADGKLVRRRKTGLAIYVYIIRFRKRNLPIWQVSHEWIVASTSAST